MDKFIKKFNKIMIIFLLNFYFIRHKQQDFLPYKNQNKILVINYTLNKTKFKSLKEKIFTNKNNEFKNHLNRSNCIFHSPKRVFYLIETIYNSNLKTNIKIKLNSIRISLLEAEDELDEEDECGEGEEVEPSDFKFNAELTRFVGTSHLP